MIATGTMEPRAVLRQGLSAIKSKWPVLHAALAYHRTTRGAAMTFADKPWLTPIYKDNAREMVLMKCSQVGITEYAICRMICLAEQKKRGLYLLPDDAWRQTFVGDRIDGLIDRAPAYRAIVGTDVNAFDPKRHDSKQFKLIHGTAWKFAGSHAKTVGSIGQANDPVGRNLRKPKAGFEYQASALIIDEYDEHEQGDLVYFYDRLADEAEPVILKFGNPTISARGIALEYNRSDQKAWLVPCSCGTDHELKWLDHFVHEVSPGRWALRSDTEQPVCTKCGNPFDRTARGRWAKRNPKSAISGYNISRLFIKKTPRDIGEMYLKFIDAQGNQTKLQNFFNNWCGETYENAEEQVTEGLLALASRKGPDKIGGAWQPGKDMFLVAGVDQGKDYHVWIDELIDGVGIPRFIGTVHTPDQLNNLLDEFRVGCVVMDAQGGGYAATRSFVEQREGAYMCYYVARDSISHPYVVDDETQVVKTNRTEMCDTMVARLKDGHATIPKNYASHVAGELKRQLMAPVRTTDSGGRPVWTKGVDHYFHASVYKTIATLIAGITNSTRERKSWRI